MVNKNAQFKFKKNSQTNRASGNNNFQKPVMIRKNNFVSNEQVRKSFQTTQLKQSLSQPKQVPMPKSDMKASDIKERKFLNMTSGQPQPQFKPS